MASTEMALEAATEPTPSLGKMKQSNSIAKLVEALSAAQSHFLPVKKTVSNPQYNSKYADLDAVIDATRPALNAQGLVVMQFCEADVAAKQVTIVTKLAHKSGEWIDTTLVLPATMRERFDAQSIGSAMTYGRRYGWQAIVGVAAEIDDDANQASDSGSKEAAQAVAQQKIAVAKSKKAEAAVTPNGGVPDALAHQPEEIQLLLKKSVEAFRKDDTEHKRPYRVLEGLDSQDRTIKLYCFDNHAYNDGAKIFDLLDMAAGFKNGAPVSFKVAYEKNYVILKQPIAIAGLRFDDNGEAMLDAKRD